MSLIENMFVGRSSVDVICISNASCIKRNTTNIEILVIDRFYLNNDVNYVL